eukprot:355620-Chlamydomonas_euryale.AAC.3
MHRVGLAAASLRHSCPIPAWLGCVEGWRSGIRGEGEGWGSGVRGGRRRHQECMLLLPPHLEKAAEMACPMGS